MRFTVTLSNGAIETEPSGDPLHAIVLVRHTPNAAPVPLDQSESFRAHVKRISDRDLSNQLTEMRTLSRTNRRTDPVFRSLWLLCFMVPPPFMVNLHLRAGVMDDCDPHAARIRKALKRARWAVGWGDRGSGRAKKNASFTGA